MTIATAFILSGCPSLGPRAEPPPTVDRAEMLARQGDHAGAGRVYEAIAAETTGSARNENLLRAAQAYLTARRGDAAARVLAQIAQPVTALQRFEQQMLTIELALVRGQGQQAWQQLAAIPQPSSAPEATRYLRLRRQVAFATNRPVEAVLAQIAGERWLTTAAARQASRRELLLELREVAERGVRIEPSAAPNALVRGWLELAGLAAAAARNPNFAAPDIETWRARYPNHPASNVVRTELLGETVEPTDAARHVALLLPLSGRAAGAALSVRDGFIAAYYQSPAEQRPLLRIYDTGEASAAEAIARATSDGAEFIVGPLTREAVSAAADLAGTRPPILALNFLPPERVAPSAFYQFALSPEDEARQVARRVLADGHRRGVALFPDNDWGTRVLGAFTQELEGGGGALIGSAPYDPGLTDYSQSITDVLGLTASRSRHRRLESTLGTRLQFEPRRRGDIQFILAAGPARSARLLRPQLRFHFAGDIPTYATSDAFEPGTRFAEDLEGLIFPDMPWVLGGPLAERVRADVSMAWPGSGATGDRLFAFGFDAYQIFTALQSPGAPSNFNVAGLTGRLTLDGDRRVRRELNWTQMVGGQLQPPPGERF